MTSALLVLLLAAHPNLFEPNEMGSEDVFAGVAVCMDKAMTNGSTSAQAVPMCGCLMDAIRLNTKAGKRPPENNAAAEQLTKCHAESTQPKAHKPGNTGT